MNRLQEIADRLAPTQLAELEDFAEFLAARPPRPTLPPPRRTPTGGIDASAVAGMCAGMGGEKTAVELVHEALDARAAKYMDEG